MINICIVCLFYQNYAQISISKQYFMVKSRSLRYHTIESKISHVFVVAYNCITNDNRGSFSNANFRTDCPNSPSDGSSQLMENKLHHGIELYYRTIIWHRQYNQEINE
jgi:hypothetical protein